MTPGAIDPIMLALFLGALTLLPLLLIISTSFLKIAMVLMITRNAIGVQQVPPAIAIYAIALAATLFVMAPVIHAMNDQIKAYPMKFESVEEMQSSFTKIVQPLREFIAKNTSPDVKAHFIETARIMWPDKLVDQTTEDDLIIVIPSFVVSELQAGFKIGFLVYIPFIVIDLVVSNLLLALGMQMVAPITIAIPIKILLFVFVDGWSRLLDALIFSYL